MNSYITLQEFNDDDKEAWLYFIKYEGNEENIAHLKAQLESFDWYIQEDCSTFNIDDEHKVSTETAKQITKLELNTKWHRKFDGVLEKIDLGFKDGDTEEDKMDKAFAILGYGQIENFIDDEDIDDEDLADSTYSSTESFCSDESSDIGDIPSLI